MRDVGRFRAFAFSILRNIINDRWRGKKRSPAEVAIPEIDLWRFPDRDAVDQETSTLLRQLLNMALANLDPEDREIVLMRVSGLEFSEIKDTLNSKLAVGALRSCYSRALKQMREFINSKEG